MKERAQMVEKVSRLQTAGTTEQDKDDESQKVVPFCQLTFAKKDHTAELAARRSIAAPK